MYKFKNIFPIIAAILNASIIGLSFLFIKNAINVLDPIPTLAFRFLIAFIVMSILVLLKVIKVDFKNKNIKTLILFSIVQPVLYFSLQAYAMKYASSSEGGIMNALTPIIVMVMGSYFLKEKVSAKQKLFIFLSVFGVIFIFAMDGFNANNNFIGIFLLFLSVICTAIYTIMGRKLSNEFSPMELTYGMMTIGALVFTVATLLYNREGLSIATYVEPLKNKQFLIAILYLSILSSILTSILANYAVSKMEASKAGIFSNLSTVVSILAGVIVLKENFYFYHLIGTIMILVGVIGVNIEKMAKTEELTSEENI